MDDAVDAVAAALAGLEDGEACDEGDDRGDEVVLGKMICRCSKCLKIIDKIDLASDSDDGGGGAAEAVADPRRGAQKRDTLEAKPGDGGGKRLRITGKSAEHSYLKLPAKLHFRNAKPQRNVHEAYRILDASNKEIVCQSAAATPKFEKNVRHVFGLISERAIVTRKDSTVC